MNRKHAAIYLATVMMGILGGLCLPKAWYQKPVPRITAAHVSGHVQPVLLADGR